MTSRAAALLGSAIFAATFPQKAFAEVPSCTAPLGEPMGMQGVEVIELPDGEGAYRMLRVEADGGAHMLVYFDAASEPMARSRAPCLGAQLNLLREELGDTRIRAEWESVVFTADHAYVPPRGADVRTRWLVHTVPEQLEGGVTAFSDPQRKVLRVIPHEQVHHFQARDEARTPRWFAEGHANWVEVRVADRLKEGEGQASRAETLAKLGTANGPVNLAAWQMVRPKREAIMRQVSAEDRARMEADPDYTPKGSFTFTMDDLEGDESNMLARYAASLLVFEELEERHGADKVRDWAFEVTAQPGTVTSEMLARSVGRWFGEDLDTLLAERSMP